jgi:DNA-binding transcriptional LysR family regulator
MDRMLLGGRPSIQYAGDMSSIATRYGLPDTIDLVQLRYVRHIARCENMTEAARQLGVSQPTLSNAVRLLEHRLGAPLFLRGPRGVTATESGRLVARAADEVLAVLQQADESLRDVETAPSGSFTVGYHHAFGAIFLPQLMRELPRRAPGLELSLWEGIGPRVIDAVIDRTVHFGIDTTSGASSRPHPDLVAVPMFRDVVCVVTGKHRLPASAPLFHVPRIPPSARVVEALQTAGRWPGRVITCGDLELVKSLVLSGAGLGVLPWRVALRDAARTTLRLLDPKLPFEVDVGCLFYRADLHRTRATMVLRDELLRRGRQLDEVPMPCGVAAIDRPTRR